MITPSQYGGVGCIRVCLYRWVASLLSPVRPPEPHVGNVPLGREDEKLERLSTSYRTMLGHTLKGRLS